MRRMSWDQRGDPETGLVVIVALVILAIFGSGLLLGVVLS